MSPFNAMLSWFGKIPNLPATLFGQRATNDLESSNSQALDYTLPDHVKTIKEMFVQRATSMGGINMAFLAFNVALAASTLAYKSSISSTAFSALHALVYVNSITNLTAVALSVVFIHQVNHLACAARELFDREPQSWPARASRRELLPGELRLLTGDRDFEVMVRFGLPEDMRLVWKALLFGSFLGGGTLLSVVVVFMCVTGG